MFIITEKNGKKRAQYCKEFLTYGCYFFCCSLGTVHCVVCSMEWKPEVGTAGVCPDAAERQATNLAAHLAPPLNAHASHGLHQMPPPSSQSSNILTSGPPNTL